MKKVYAFKEADIRPISYFLALVFLWPVASMGGLASQPWGPLGEIEKDARKEGKVVLYVAPGHGNAESARVISQLFKDKYGVAVDWTGMDSRDMTVRLLAEQRTKQYVADIAMSGPGGSYSTLKPMGYVLPILAPSTLEKGVWRLDPASATPRDRGWFYIYMPVSPSLYINTNLVSPEEQPNSYADLLNAKWKGKIVLQDPANPGSGTGWFRATYLTLGSGYMKDLARQVVLVHNVNDPPDMVARSQYPIGLAVSTIRGLELIKEGAPVKFIHPKEGSHLFVIGTSFIANAPHPNSAKLFLHWFFTKEGQTIYAKYNQVISLRKDVPQDYTPPDMRYPEGAPVMMAAVEDLTAEGSQKLLKLIKQIFGERK